MAAKLKTYTTPEKALYAAALRSADTFEAEEVRLITSGPLHDRFFVKGTGEIPQHTAHTAHAVVYMGSLQDLRVAL